ncbi:UNKNOWN [Stylonychia lemnae]|uniref:DOMON domain-containing protein n=1 Tax=Stylonychia lemnae TaxID=5949 RepID=A0A078A3P0_STYLE|nr:UNKNOWN [Stylonychia lemnae]|eukprot:CDW76148.1 UNKNOWN [Stylonychia lemnae]
MAVAAVLICTLSFQVTAVDPVEIKSRINFNNFTDQFSAEWYAYDKQDGSGAKLRVTLRIKNLSTKDWIIGNNDGVWLGIGLGNTVMRGTDVVMCTYRFSGYAVSDIFACTDRYASAWNEPVIDGTQNVDDISSQRLFNEVMKLGELAAIFDRSLTTTDTEADFKFSAGSSIDAVWAWGFITSGNVQYHGNQATNRDSFNMRISSMRSSAKQLIGNLYAIIGASLLLISATFI